MRDEATVDAVRDAVVDLDLGLVRLEQRRGSLEDLFRDAEDRPEADGEPTVEGEAGAAPTREQAA